MRRGAELGERAAVVGGGVADVAVPAVVGEVGVEAAHEGVPVGLCEDAGGRDGCRA